MAITLSLQDLVGSMDEATRRNLFAIACELVALEGGETAPDSVSNEAVVLVAAYLQKRQGGSVSEKENGRPQHQISCGRVCRPIERC